MVKKISLDEFLRLRKLIHRSARPLDYTIGNYYWGTHFITRDLNILRKFDRLDFPVPVREK